SVRKISRLLKNGVKTLPIGLLQPIITEMAKYTSKKVSINRGARELFDRFSTMQMLQQRVDSLPDDVKAQLGELRFENDRLIIVTPQVGEIAFKVKERVEPSKVVFTAEGAPVPLDMTVSFNGTDEHTTEVETCIDVEIPMMLKPMVGPYMQKAADKFGELIANLNS
ncbi:MAG: hypothetical protein NC311_17695, partial [Muribaculaceae bacterium]|nr:hypothetical protein [Muribaculaceae bacterium]